MNEDSFHVDLNGHELEDGDPSQEPPSKKPKRFQCKHCQRLFARLEHLQRHERTRMITKQPLLVCARLTITLDTREKPFACNRCDSKFTRRYADHPLMFINTNLS